MYKKNQKTFFRRKGYKANIRFWVNGSVADVMPKAKKYLLLHERKETWRIRIGKKRSNFCELCEAEVEWLTSAEAAKMSGRSEREVFRLVENGQVHFAETEIGALMICSRSLAIGKQE